MANIELTGSQVKELQALDQAIKDLQGVLAKGRLAGLNVDALEQKLNEAQTMRVGMLTHFSPGLGPREKR